VGEYVSDQQGQPSDDSGHRRTAPAAPWHRTDDEESDFLLTESRGTRHEAPAEARRERRGARLNPPPISDAVRRSIHGFLSFVERRRLSSILNGSDVLYLDADGTVPAVRHRHWVGLAVRLAGACCALVAAILISPPLVALAILSAVHGLLLLVRRDIAKHWPWIYGGTEFAAGAFLGAALGMPALRFCLVLAGFIMIGLTVAAWRVDMEFITGNRVLVRTRGLLLLKRSVEAPLSSIRIADVAGPFFGLGWVTVDTTSDRDHLLHNFGLISAPNEWTAILLREARAPVSPLA
jgi:hypothetical protein